MKNYFLLLFLAMAIPSKAAVLTGFGSFKIAVIENRLTVYLHDSIVISDSIYRKEGSCTGFSFPEKQPFKNCFIFTKHELKNGKTYILYEDGEWRVIDGGSFWAGEKHSLLFINAERAHPNLVVYNIANRKIDLEKFNCDEFTDWFYLKEEYFGVVSKECNEEYRKDKELTEWLHPVIVESYFVRYNALEEMTKKPKEIQKATKLSFYCDCPE